METRAPGGGSQMIVVVGTSASGKSECADYLAKLGYHKIGASAYTIRHVDQTLGFFEHREAWRAVLEEKGFDYATRCALEDLNRLPTQPKKIVIEGIRTWEDINLLKQRGPIVVIGIWRAAEAAYEHARQRRRDDAPHSFEEYVRGAAFEYSLGLGRVLYAADHILVNTGDISELTRTLLECVQGNNP